MNEINFVIWKFGFYVEIELRGILSSIWHIDNDYILH